MVDTIRIERMTRCSSGNCSTKLSYMSVNGNSLGSIEPLVSHHIFSKRAYLFKKC